MLLRALTLFDFVQRDAHGRLLMINRGMLIVDESH